MEAFLLSTLFSKSWLTLFFTESWRQNQCFIRSIEFLFRLLLICLSANRDELDLVTAQFSIAIITLGVFAFSIDGILDDA